MSLLEKNLNELHLKNPQLVKKILEHTEITSEFEFQEAKSGDALLFKNGVSIHNEIDPENEAIEHFQSIRNNVSTSMNIIYGLGLGYILKRFAKSAKGQIIVYEKDLDILRLVLEVVDFSEELALKNVHLVDNLADIEKIYLSEFFTPFDQNIIILNYYRQNKTAEVGNFIHKTSEIHGIFESNYKTFLSKTNPWIYSGVSKLNQLINYENLSVLKNKFSNKPAVIISAGPSLSKNIKYVKENRDKLVVFCVGTALRKVVKEGITPDFVNFIEHGPMIMQQVKDIDTSEMNLIMQPITYNEIYNLPAKNKFIYLADNDSVSKWLSRLFNIDNSIFLNRGTVSINAFVSAQILGCNPIILIGQDLAYTDQKCYADGTIYESYKVTTTSENKTTIEVENKEEHAKKAGFSDEQVEKRLNKLNEQLYYVKSYDGKILASPGDYVMFIKYFEEIAEKLKEKTTLINATEGGAFIEHFEYMTLKEAIEKYAKEPLKIDVQANLSNGRKIQERKILADIVQKAHIIYLYSLSLIYEKGLALTENIDNTERLEHKKCLEILPELLNLYKQFYSQVSKNSFLLLITEKLRFPINFYIKHLNMQDEEMTYRLSYFLINLFQYEFGMFYFPIILQTKIMPDKH